MTTKRMKIRITTTVEIDPQAWATEFGLDADDKQAIREDVQTYLANGCAEQLLALGMEQSA